MRNLTNVPKLEQEWLRNIYPHLANLICDLEPHNYKKIFVSIFDQTLTIEEAIDQLDSVSPEEQERRNNAFLNFNKELVESTACLKVVLKGIKKDRVLFKEFNSREAALKCISPYKSNFIVAVPEYEAIYFQSWDDTVIFFYINDKITKLLKKLSSKNGLHVYF